MQEKHLTEREREDIRIVMEATQRLLPLYELLTAAEELNEEEQAMLEQIRQTFQEVLAYSGLMMEQIQALQFENALDTVLSNQQIACQNEEKNQAAREDPRRALANYRGEPAEE
ncbi:MAG: hypothetical protein H7Z75_02170 [Ferruginibacter sp.]|nr:hypothetical protein [Cytophagales bacterium]